MMRARLTAVLVAVALAFVALAACGTHVVELGVPDAKADAPGDSGTSCRCRITPCRVTGDCALIGGACGPDLFCVGDFGTCTTNAQCQATASASLCTRGTTSTLACP